MQTMDEHIEKNEEKLILIIGVDLERSERVGRELVEQGHCVYVIENRYETGYAILKVLPDLILLDYSEEAHVEGLTPTAILKYLGGDSAELVPPVLVMTSPGFMHKIPCHPNILPILLPTSLEIVSALVQAYM
jgi:PleD family two-component response regulator